MKKLYQKNELWFSLLWIFIYVMGTSFADEISRIVGVEKSVTVLWLVGLSIVVLIWLKKQKLYEYYGLCRSDIPASGFLYYLPLALMVSCNLWFGVTLNLSILETVFYIGSMFCVGFLEELIFRGFLFKAMCKDGVKAAVIVSSITFGIGHIVNLFNGSGADWLSTVCQICYAIAAGYLFVIIFYHGKSLLPCIVTHSCLNALSAFSNEAAMTTGRTIVSAVLLTVISLGYALVLAKKLPGVNQNDIK